MVRRRQQEEEQQAEERRQADAAETQARAWQPWQPSPLQPWRVAQVRVEQGQLAAGEEDGA
jgi:hypothetical protein